MASTGTAEIQAQTASKHGHAKAHSGISSYMNQTLSDNQELLVLAGEIKELLTTINHTTRFIEQVATGVNTNSKNPNQLLALSENLRGSLSNQTTQLDSLGVQIAGAQADNSNKLSEIKRKLPVATNVLQQSIDSS